MVQLSPPLLLPATRQTSTLSQCAQETAVQWVCASHLPLLPARGLEPPGPVGCSSQRVTTCNQLLTCCCNHYDASSCGRLNGVILRPATTQHRPTLKVTKAERKPACTHALVFGAGLPLQRCWPQNKSGARCCTYHGSTARASHRHADDGRCNVVALLVVLDPADRHDINGIGGLVAGFSKLLQAQR